MAQRWKNDNDENVYRNAIAMGNAMVTVLTVLRKASCIYVEEIRIIIRIPY